MNVVILGATKGIGRALARACAQAGHSVALLGRDAQELAKSAEDLRARFPGPNFSTHQCDLAQTDSFAPALDAAAGALSRIDAVVLTAASFSTQDELERDEEKLAALLHLNFVQSILFCEIARKKLLAQGGGTLCVFSSVAGDRGRKPVVLYGATKAGLSYYCEALDHRFRQQGLVTVCIKPGFVKTSMTEGLKPPPFAGEPDAVAKEVLAAIETGKAVVYTPSVWRWVMWAIRQLPRGVMRKLSF